MLPCLTNETLKLLMGTADERYQFSREYFRATHFPQTMRRFFQHRLLHEVREEELFDELTGESAVGNRVYLLFGSTGSGKSELMCWLQDQWGVKQVSRPVIRLSRSELNPQLLIRKCYEALGLDAEQVADDRHWELFVQKPVAIVNQMIWTTLAEFLESDEEIVPLALLLRPVIEGNIREFVEQVRKQDVQTPLEILNESQFDELMSGTTLPLEIDHPSFRQAMLEKLDRYLFQGQDLATLFKGISQQLRQKQIRPLLLVDDLIQSVNLYASVLLDHLINLEEGNWDVVIGMTPGALQETEKGRGLIRRLNELDTVEDRVTKLWLSDEAGKEFYSLPQEHVTSYVETYLTELKKGQGYICSEECVHANECRRLLIGEEASLSLLPFNRHLIRRLYDGIPDGKGKLRYLLLHMREVLRFFKQGKKERVLHVKSFVRRDRYVEHDDPLVKILAEWYVGDESEQVTLTAPLLGHFDRSHGELTLSVKDLLPVTVVDVEEKREEVREGEYSTYRRWIEGEKVNRELLEPIRTGVASLVQDVVKGTFMSRVFTPRTSAVLQRGSVEKGVRYPILFEGEDSGSGIQVQRKIGTVQVAGFQQKKVQERRQWFASLAQDYSVADWIYQGEMLRDTWMDEVERALGSSLATFALRLREWVQGWRRVGERTWAAHVEGPFDQRLEQLVENLYMDWYLLRDNMVEREGSDGVKSLRSFEQWMLQDRTNPVLKRYQFGEGTLFDFIENLKSCYREYVIKIEPGFWGCVERIGRVRDIIEGEEYSGSEMLLEELELLELLELLECEEVVSFKAMNILLRIEDWCLARKLLGEEYTQKGNKWRVPQTELISCLAMDLGWPESIDTYTDAVHRLTHDGVIGENLSSQIRRLLVSGETLLPVHQWKDIMQELEMRTPAFYSKVRIQLEI